MQLAVVPGADGDVGLEPRDRLEAVLGGLPAELHDAEQAAVVGDGDRGLSVGGGARAHLVYALRPVEQRVGRMVM